MVRLFTCSDVLTDIWPLCLTAHSHHSRPHRLWSFTELAWSAWPCAASGDPGSQEEQALSRHWALQTLFWKLSSVTIKYQYYYPDFYTNTLYFTTIQYLILPSFCLCFYHKGVTGTWLNVNVLNLSACLTDRGMLCPSQRLFSSRLSHLIFDIVGRDDLYCSCVKWNISI